MSSFQRVLADVLKLTSAILVLDELQRDACVPEMQVARAALHRAAMQSGATVEAVESPRPLTPREIEVLRLLADGASYKDVASELGITVSTAQSRAKQIYRKLGVHSKMEAAAALDARLRGGRASG